MPDATRKATIINGSALSIATFLVMLSLGFLFATFLGEELGASLSPNHLAGASTALLGVFSAFTIKAGFEGCRVKALAGGALASLIVGILAFATVA